MAREKDRPDIPPGTPLQRIRPLLITFVLIALVGPLVLSAYWLNTFTTAAKLLIYFLFRKSN